MPQNDDAIIYIIIFSLIMLFFIIAVIYIAFLGSNPKKKQKEELVEKIEQKDENLDINDLNSIASNSQTTKNDLFKIVRYYLKNFEIPPKVDGKAPPESDPYLLFVYLVASNRNADAKLIAFMVISMCNRYLDYTIEIETQEKRAINFRTMK